jgi:hypothetical protein
MSRARLSSLLWLLALASCKDVTRFSTEPGEAYCGPIVGGAFVRSGFDPSIKLGLTFDAEHIADRPGSISTSDGMFKGAPLRAIPELSSDPLWTLDFGEGREKNVMYMVDPTDAAAGPSVTAIVSFLHDGDAEVRLLRGAPNLDGSPTPAANGKVLFGVFTPLHRKKEPCGF